MLAASENHLGPSLDCVLDTDLCEHHMQMIFTFWMTFVNGIFQKNALHYVIILIPGKTRL